MRDRLHFLTLGLSNIALLLLLGGLSGCETDSERTDYGLELMGNYSNVAGDISEVILSDNRAWALTSITNSILTFNLSDAAAPVPVGAAVVPDWQQDEFFVSAAWASDSLLLCTSTRNMKFVKITESAQPDYFGWDFSGQINHVHAQSEGETLTILAADRSPEDGIQSHSYDTSSGSSFWEIAQAAEQDVFTDFDNDINDLVVVDGFLFIADGAYGLKVFQIDSLLPLELNEIATLPLAGDARRLVADGDLLVIAAGAGGVYTVDISDPFLPVVRSRFQASYTAYDVALYRDHVFAAWSSSGVLVIDITNPANPQPTHYYDLPSARRIDVNDEVIAVVDREEGLFFLANPF